ncbi:MAG: transketolase [bacterium]
MRKKVDQIFLQKQLLFHQAKQIRLTILEMINAAQCSHIGSAFSIVDILTVLFHKFINTDLIKQKSKKRDYFILSKGHACAALYATLASVGLIHPDELKNYYKDGSKLAGHPIKDSFPGIEASTGSLGHGLSMAVGLAIACKNNQMACHPELVSGSMDYFPLANKIYVLLGDGECQEGSVWEAVMMAVRFKLDNLVLIIDKNNLQALDRTSDVVCGSWHEKFVAFGCNCMCVDGHNFDQLTEALQKTGKSLGPDVIIANTIKGKGVSFMQDKLEWHYKSPNLQEYEMAKKGLLEQL